MSSKIGENVKVLVYGQSHSAEIGVEIDGLKQGEKIDIKKIEKMLFRRQGVAELSTPRREKDQVEFIQGVEKGVTTGEKIKAVIKNQNVISKSYDNVKTRPRPSHADYGAFVKFGKDYNFAGGGEFSGRLTAPMCIAGAICLGLLEEKGIYIGAHVLSVKDACDKPFDVNVDKQTLKDLEEKEIPILDDKADEKIRETILSAKAKGDSVGGVIECAIVGMPVGIGGAMFDGIEGAISKAVFGVPAVKGIEFGSGFNGTKTFGSENNDPYYYDGDVVKTKTNNAGGINGGISNGMPIVFRVATKPTPTISIPQQTVDLVEKKTVIESYHGRHDPCVTLRAVPGIISVTAIAIYDLILGLK